MYFYRWTTSMQLPLELREKNQEEIKMSALDSQVGGSHYKDRKIQPRATLPSLLRTEAIQS